MYYDINTTRAISDKEMQQRGLPVDDADTLERLGFYPLTIEKPDYDPTTQGVEPDGYPAPDAANPRAFVQHMRVFSIMERAKAKKKDAATAKRWEYETRGITTPDGTVIKTGIDDQNRIASSLQGMANAGMTETPFKAENGWVTITLEQLTQISALIATHVEACFGNEFALHQQIDACETLEQLNAINLDEGWPGSSNDDEADETLPTEGETPASPAPDDTQPVETTDNEGGNA